jgi:hypothetical protein
LQRITRSGKTRLLVALVALGGMGQGKCRSPLHFIEAKVRSRTSGGGCEVPKALVDPFLVKVHRNDVIVWTFDNECAASEAPKLVFGGQSPMDSMCTLTVSNPVPAGKLGWVACLVTIKVDKETTFMYHPEPKPTGIEPNSEPEIRVLP